MIAVLWSMVRGRWAWTCDEDNHSGVGVRNALVHLVADWQIKRIRSGR